MRKLYISTEAFHGHQGNGQGACRQWPRGMQAMTRGHAGNGQGACRQWPGGMQAMARGHAGNCLCCLREVSGLTKFT